MFAFVNFIERTKDMGGDGDDDDDDDDIKVHENPSTMASEITNSEVRFY